MYSAPSVYSAKTGLTLRVYPEGSGNPISAINYFVLDDEHCGLHQVFAMVIEEDAEVAEEMTRDLLTSSRFVEVDSASN